MTTSSTATDRARERWEADEQAAYLRSPQATLDAALDERRGATCFVAGVAIGVAVTLAVRGVAPAWWLAVGAVVAVLLWGATIRAAGAHAAYCVLFGLDRQGRL